MMLEFWHLARLTGNGFLPLLFLLFVSFVCSVCSGVFCVTDFATFISSMLSSVADFLWAPATRWITGCVLLILIVHIFVILLNIGRKE